MKKLTLFLCLMATLLMWMVPAPATAAPARSGPPVSGEFVITGFEPTSVSPTQNGKRCLIEGTVSMGLTGPLSGSASGPIAVLVHAPCSEATTNPNPPGTFRDTFEATLAFNGSIGGTAENATILYSGHTHPGSAVKGKMKVDGADGSHATLNVEAQAGSGGSYYGPFKSY